MVTSYPEPVGRTESRPRFLYICGCDGTGKTTQARLLLARLKEAGIQPRHLWLRFPFFFSLPLLAYARWRGFSWYEESGNVRHGYWDFRHSWLLQTLFPWVLLLDAALASIFKIYLPLSRNQTIVCERFVLDMLVDMAIACGDTVLHDRVLRKLYLRLLPTGASIVVLDLDAQTVRKRRPDLLTDQCLESRLKIFRLLSKEQSLAVLSSALPAVELSQHIWEMYRDSR